MREAAAKTGDIIGMADMVAATEDVPMPAAKEDTLGFEWDPSSVSNSSSDDETSSDEPSMVDVTDAWYQIQ